jgi:hypothetical protein
MMLFNRYRVGLPLWDAVLALAFVGGVLLVEKVVERD